MKKVMTAIATIIIVIILLAGIGFATGGIQALYNNTVGVKVSSSETNMFHKSQGFTDGMLQDLSKYQLELSQEKDPTARAAIIDHIQQQFAGYDSSTIQNASAKQFLIDCMNNNIK